MSPVRRSSERTYQEPVRTAGQNGAPPNKGMKLTKLSAAWLPGWTCRLMPAPAGSDAGTASQLIPGVRRTRGWTLAKSSEDARG
jgi:hypothetical protein